MNRKHRIVLRSSTRAKFEAPRCRRVAEALLTSTAEQWIRPHSIERCPTASEETETSCLLWRPPVHQMPIKKSSPDRSAARARSDRGPRCSSAARRARVIATGVPHAPCRGHVPGRRQPPAPCARVAVMSGEIAPASRWPAPCAQSRPIMAAVGCDLPHAGPSAFAPRRLPPASYIKRPSF
jgi:hypothetical protein